MGTGLLRNIHLKEILVNINFNMEMLVNINLIWKLLNNSDPWMLFYAQSNRYYAGTVTTFPYRFDAIIYVIDTRVPRS